MGNDLLGNVVGGLVAIYVIDKLTGKRKKVYVKPNSPKLRKVSKPTKKKTVSRKKKK
jgi:hypothetical protein